MQDRFKFRFWNKIYKQIETWQGCHLDTALKNENLIPMQCTGLKDKNNKLIYEGDIVAEISSGMICIIEWHKPTCALMAHVRRMDELVTLDELVNDFGDCPCQVIGNIYENPELIESEVI